MRNVFNFSHKVILVVSAYSTLLSNISLLTISSCLSARLSNLPVFLSASFPTGQSPARTKFHGSLLYIRETFSHPSYLDYDIPWPLPCHVLPCLIFLTLTLHLPCAHHLTTSLLVFYHPLLPHPSCFTSHSFLTSPHLTLTLFHLFLQSHLSDLHLSCFTAYFSLIYLSCIFSPVLAHFF